MLLYDIDSQSYYSVYYERITYINTVISAKVREIHFVTQKRQNRCTHQGIKVQYFYAVSLHMAVINEKAGQGTHRPAPRGSFPSARNDMVAQILVSVMHVETYNHGAADPLCFRNTDEIDALALRK